MSPVVMIISFVLLLVGFFFHPTALDSLLFPLRTVYAHFSLSERRERARACRRTITESRDRLTQLEGRFQADQIALARSLDVERHLRAQILSWRQVSDRLKGWVQALDSKARYYHLYSPEASLCQEIVALKNARKVTVDSEVEAEQEERIVSMAGREVGCQTEEVEVEVEESSGEEGPVATEWREEMERMTTEMAALRLQTDRALASFKALEAEKQHLLAEKDAEKFAAMEAVASSIMQEAEFRHRSVLQHQLQQQQEELTAAVGAEITDYQTMINTLQFQVNSLQTSAGPRDQELAALQGQIEAANAEKRGLVSQLQHSQQESAEWREQVDKQAEQVKRAESQRKSSAQRQNALLLDKEDLEMSNKRLQKAVKGLEKERDELKQALEQQSPPSEDEMEVAMMGKLALTESADEPAASFSPIDTAQQLSRFDIEIQVDELIEEVKAQSADNPAVAGSPIDAEQQSSSSSDDMDARAGHVGQEEQPLEEEVLSKSCAIV